MRLGTTSPSQDERELMRSQPLSPILFEQLEPRLLLSSTGLINPVDNSAVLTGYVTQDIVIETSFDWLATKLTITPDQSGSIFQSPDGGDNPPPSFVFPWVPKVEFDTFVSSGLTADAPYVGLTDGSIFNADQIDAICFNTSTVDIGILTLARVTLDANASGTWEFAAYTAANAQIPQFVGSGDIVNGQLIESGLPSEISVTAQGKTAVSFQDGTGDWVTVSLRGNGTAELYFDDTGPRDMSRIVLSGTDARSSLMIKTKGAGSSTTVGQILIEDGSLGKILAKTTDVIGAGIEATGSGWGKGYVSSMQVRDFKNGADILLAGTSAPRGITIKAGRLYADTDITLGSYLKTFMAIDWVGSSLTAPWASNIAIKGNRRAGITGDLGADITLTGVDPRRSMSLNKLKVAGTLRGSEIRTFGSVGTIMLGAIDGSDVLVGISGSVSRHAAARDDFDNPSAYIKSMKIKGLRLPKGAVIPRFVINSNLSAATIGTVGLLNVDWDNGSELFGLWAYADPLNDREIKSVSYKDTVSGERWRWPFGDGEVFSIPDLMIEII